MKEFGKKKCQVCIGCGRCASTAAGLRVITESFLKQELLPIGNTMGKGSFVVVDIGTTTIAMELYDNTGKKLEQYVQPNPQRIFGADVISRIQAAENGMNARQMRAQVLRVLTEGLNSFQEKCDRIEKVYIAGNTTMNYLLCGHDVQPLGYAPFRADFLQSEEMKIGETAAVTMPGLSAFVGGDIVAGILACGLHKKQEISLLIDLGTNGEMALGNREKILACSTAAGPAFEGMLQAQGKAIWGADIVEYTAQLLQRGLIDETGLLADPYFETGILVGGVHLTQENIRSFQTAKAAIAAGIQMLIQEYGLESEAIIDTVYLAGGFGYYLKEEASLQVGLLPKGLTGRVRAVGNSALAGCYAYHYLEQGKQETEQIRRIAKVLNLTELKAFTTSFVENMYLKELLL